MHSTLTQLKINIPIRKMHCLAPGLRKVQFRWNQVNIIMVKQNFKRNLLLNLYREVGKKITLVCFFLLLKREREKMSDTCNLFLVWRLLAFLPATLSPWLHSNVVIIFLKLLISLIWHTHAISQYGQTAFSASRKSYLSKIYREKKACRLMIIRDYESWFLYV